MLSNQDKKEMLEMIAECVKMSEYTNIHTKQSVVSGVSLEASLIKKASSLPQDKPERKMPEVGNRYLFIDISDDRFSVGTATWNGEKYQIKIWNRGLGFLLSERELAEKKCADLDAILKTP